jgi:hypothetical protein
MRDNLTYYAADIGRSHGTTAAQWAFDGNTDDETYRRVLAGIEDGDPEILDAYRVPDLSGDYTVDDLVRELGLGGAADGHDADLGTVCGAYRQAAGDAFWREAERIAREHEAAMTNRESAGRLADALVAAERADFTGAIYGPAAFNPGDDQGVQQVFIYRCGVCTDRYVTTVQGRAEVLTAGNLPQGGPYYVAECATDTWSCRHRHESLTSAAWCGWVKYGPDRYAADVKLGPGATPAWRVRRYTPDGTRLPLSQADYDEMFEAFIAWDKTIPDEN